MGEDLKNTSRLLHELERLTFAGEAGDFGIVLDDSQLSGEEAEAIRLLNIAIEKYRYSVGSDLQKHKLAKERMAETLTHREHLISTGNRAAEILLSTVDDININAALMSSMEVVGRSTGVDRVQIWCNEVIKGELYFKKEYEWSSDAGKVISSAPVGMKYPYRDRPGWGNLFLSGGYINNPLADLSLNDQKFLGAFDVKSIVLIPLFLQNQFWGFFGLIDCRNERYFAEDEINILRSISLMLASAVNRSMQAAKIRDANEHTKLLLDAMPLCCHLWDRSLNMFDFNEANYRFFQIDNREEFMTHYFDLSPEYQPDGTKSAASFPVTSAANSCSFITVGSSL